MGKAGKGLQKELPSAVAPGGNDPRQQRNEEEARALEIKKDLDSKPLFSWLFLCLLFPQLQLIFSGFR